MHGGEGACCLRRGAETCFSAEFVSLGERWLGRWLGLQLAETCLQGGDRGVHDGTDGQQVQVQRRDRLLREPRHALHLQLPVVQRVARRVAHPLCRAAWPLPHFDEQKVPTCDVAMNREMCGDLERLGGREQAI